MRGLNETHRALDALKVALIVLDHDEEREALTRAVFKAITRDEVDEQQAATSDHAEKGAAK